MLHALLSLFLLAGLADCAHTGAPPKRDPMDSVVRIVNDLGFMRRTSCSGVSVGSKQVATAAHCLHDGVTPEVTTRSGQVCTAHTAVADADHDVAIINVSGCDLQPAKLGRHDLEQGDVVRVMGHGLGQAYSLKQGVVSRYDDYGRIQIDSAVNMGDSGAGLFDEHDHLVGIVSSLATPSPYGTWSGIGFANPIKHALRLR